MSADLFAEFANNPSPSPQTQQATATSSQDLFDFGSSSFPPKGRPPSPVEKWPSLQSSFHGIGGLGSGPAPISNTTNDDEDGWGDFETAEPSARPTHSTVSGPYGNFAGPARDTKPQTRPFRVPTLDLMTNTLVDVRESNQSGAKPRPKPQTSDGFSLKSHNNDSNVLFDADDFELQGGDFTEEDDNDHDDFGAFEAVAPTPSRSKIEYASRSRSEAFVDLLSLDDAPPQPFLPQDQNQQPSPSSSLRGALSFGAVSGESPTASKRLSLPSPKPLIEAGVKAWSFSKAAAGKAAAGAGAKTLMKKKHEKVKPTFQEDDDSWGAWDDMTSGGGDVKHGINSTNENDSWNWNLGATQTEATAAISSDDEPPPTNVPPPSVILSMFPELLSSGNALFKPLSGKNPAMKQRILSSPGTITFLRGYILLAMTAARVIAGRKQRWHRDKILAKSMSISAAGSKGMKLAGVDKTQSAKEEREVADVVAVWHEQVGRLRSAVMAANASMTDKAGLFKVPELSENMPVHTAKMVPTSPKACIICGLKRDERVAKVDFEVEDSFGEWWAEHWGHRSCKNFWVEHEPKIRQR